MFYAEDKFKAYLKGLVDVQVVKSTGAQTRESQSCFSWLKFAKRLISKIPITTKLFFAKFRKLMFPKVK